MDSIIAKFGKIIKDIVGGEPTYESPKKQPKVLYPDDYFCTMASNGCVEVYLYHVPGTAQLLVIDRTGINFLIEKTNRVLPPIRLIGMSAIVDYDEVCYLEFEHERNFWAHGILKSMGVSRDHPTVTLHAPRTYFDEYTQSMPTVEVRRSRLTICDFCNEDLQIHELGKMKLYLFVPQLVNHTFKFEVNFGLEGQKSDFTHIAVMYNDKLSKQKAWYNGKPVSFLQRIAETLHSGVPYDEWQFAKARANLIRKWSGGAVRPPLTPAMMGYAPPL